MKLHEVLVAFTVTIILIKILVSGTIIGIGDNKFTMGSIDAASILALLSPVMGSLHIRDYMKGRGEKNEGV